MSDVNPYAAPQSSTLAPVVETHEDEGPKPWDIGELLTTSWELFKQHWLLVILSGIVAYAVMFGIQMVSNVVVTRIVGQPIGPGGQIDWDAYIKTLALIMPISFATQALVMPGFNRLILQAARGEQLRFEVIFTAVGTFPAAIAAMLLNVLAIYLGMALLIVPGMILALGTSMHLFALSDGDGAIDSLRNSWGWTRGHKLNLFLFGLALTGINILGAIPCLLGWIVTLPVSIIAWGVLYTRLSGRTAPRAWLKA